MRWFKVLRVLWIIYKNRKVIKRSHEEALKYRWNEVGFLSEMETTDKGDELLEGVMTLGRFNEMLESDTRLISEEFNKLKLMYKIYDKNN